MSVAAALPAIAVSAALIVVLCVGDPKRRRVAGAAGWRLSTAARRSLAIAALVPGLLCALNGDAAGFLMWLGGCVLAGWGAALGVRALTAARKARGSQDICA
jgi:hypothetical protein